MEWAPSKNPTVLGIISLGVAGLVVITPASGFNHTHVRDPHGPDRRHCLLLLRHVP